MHHVFDKIDGLIRHIEQFKINPDFDDELRNRRQNKIQITTNQELFEVLVKLIAYSQQAKSERVYKIIQSGQLKSALYDYDYKIIGKTNPCDIVDNHWETIKAIRQKSKIFQIVMFARTLCRHPNLFADIKLEDIPINLVTKKDINVFWESLDKLMKSCAKYNLPFISSTIVTLLHFLLHIGYDCIKPDSSIMKVFQKMGEVNSSNSKKEQQAVVKLVQHYCLRREIKPSELDLYLMIEGLQSDSMKYVNNYRPYFN